MAVVKVTKGWKVEGAQITGRPGIESVRVGAPQVYSVQFDNFSGDNFLLALYADDGTTHVPAQFESYGGIAPWLTCVRKRVMNPNNPHLVRVLCEFDGQQSPLLLPPILSEDGRRVMEDVNDDATGRPYRNVVGQRITGCARAFYDKIFTLTRNEADDSILAGAWRGVVNSGSFTLNGHTFAAKTVLIENIKGPRLPLAGATYLVGLTTAITHPSAWVIGVNTNAYTNGTAISVTAGANGISGTIASGGGTTSLTLSGAGLTVVGNPLLIPANTMLTAVMVGTGVIYYWPATYTLAVRSRIVPVGGTPTEIGWQRREPAHGSRYRETAGGPLRSTAKYLGVPDVLLHADGTEVLDTEPDTNLVWTLYDDNLPADFSTLGLGV